MRCGIVLLMGFVCSTVVLGCDAAMSPEADRWLRAANDAYVQGDDPRAIAEATRFLQLNAGVQEAGEAYYIRGLARCRGGEMAAGRQDLAAALRATRRRDLTALAHAKLGGLAYRSGEMASAREHYRQALANAEPDESPADEATYRLGCILQRAGQWREADGSLDRLMYFFPGSPLAELAKDRVRARKWSIQAAALTSAAAAKGSQQKLRRAGVSSRVDLALRRSRMMRLVRIGSYQQHDDALVDLAKVQELFPDAYIAPAR